MKHKMAKKPTRRQKILIEKEGFDWTEWLVQDEDKLSMTIVHKTTKEKKVILC